MKQETITNAVKIFNRIIKDYQEKLIYQLELREPLRTIRHLLKFPK